ncbi:MAG: hypothetical protein V1735_03650 [Nanoarchaeota archaeon]
MHGKRGAHTDNILWPLLTIVIMIGVFLILGSKIHHIGDSDRLVAMYYSRDLALLTDTLSTTMHNAEVSYPYDLSKFDVELNVDSMTVRNKEFDEGYIVRNPLHERILQATTEQQKTITLFHDGHDLGIGSSGLKKLSCPRFTTTSDISQLILDPGHGGPKDTGIAIGSETESEVIRVLAQRISGHHPGGIASTRQLDTDISAELDTSARVAAMQNLHNGLSLHAGQEAVAKAYIASDPNTALFAERRLLACEIVNALSEDPRVSGVAIIPVELASLPDEDPRQVLSGTPAGVFLELGPGDVLKDPETGGRIMGGITRFYHGD